MDYIIVELAVRGTSERSLSSLPSPQELEAVYIRLKLKMYNDLRDQLRRKGWPVPQEEGGSGGLGGSSSSGYPGRVTA
jgi:hypothetical protein